MILYFKKIKLFKTAIPEHHIEKGSNNVNFAIKLSKLAKLWIKYILSSLSSLFYKIMFRKL